MKQTKKPLKIVSMNKKLTNDYGDLFKLFQEPKMKIFESNLFLDKLNIFFDWYNVGSDLKRSIIKYIKKEIENVR